MKKYFLLPILALLLHRPAQAQAITAAKIGHLSAKDLLASLPANMAAEAELTAYTKTWQAQYDDLSVRYAKLVKDFQLNGKTLADTAKASRAAQAEILQQQLQSMQQQAQVAIDRKRQGLYQPVNQQARQAIEAVATAKGYDYVLDDDTGQVLYIKKATNDLLAATKARLGIN